MRSWPCLPYVMKCYVLGVLQILGDYPTRNKNALSFSIRSSPTEMASTTESPSLYLVQWQLHATNGHSKQNHGEDHLFRKTPSEQYVYCHSSWRTCHRFWFFSSFKKGIICRACFFNSLYQGCWKLPWREESSKTTFESKQVIM